MERAFSRTLAGLWLGSLAGVAVILGALGWFLRSEGREQLLARDAELLSAVATVDRELHVEASLDDVPELDFYDWALAASELRGVLGMALYDPSGAVLEAVPWDLRTEPLEPPGIERIQRRGPFAEYAAEVSWEALFLDPGDVGDIRAIPLVAVWVPLSDGEGAVRAVAHYFLEGQSMKAEFAALDRNLWTQGLIAWSAFALFLTAGWRIGLDRVERVARVLDERTQELEQTNRELEMAARTAAVGSISAHLLHGLKNPLAGLRAYLRAHGDEEAKAAALRMQRLVQETLSMLRTEGHTGKGTVSWAELEMIVRAHLAEKTGYPPAELRWRGFSSEARLPSRDANLLQLVLENLLANAVEAAAPEVASIEITAHETGEPVRVLVSDRSGGIPPAVQDRLFRAGVTTRAHGSGLGLAISRQLARAWGGDLILVSSGETGATFEIRLPEQIVASPTLVSKS